MITVGLKRRAFGFALALIAGAFNLRRRLGKTAGAAASAPVVLILEPFGMGDVISLEPLIRNLHERRFEIRLSARPAWRQLYPETLVAHWIDAQVPWTSYDSRQKYRWSSFWTTSFRNYLIELRRCGRGAIGIDPRGDIRSILLLHLAGCRRVLALRSYLGTNLRVPGFSAEVVDYSDNLKRWEVNLLFLALLGLRNSDRQTPPRFTHLQVPPAISRMHRVGLIPIAPWSGKLWGVGKWAELISLLLARGREPVGLCGPGQARDAANALGAKVAIEECADMPGWVGRLRACQCVVTVDSGPMHLADAVGVPLVALFGQGQLPLWAPSGKNSQVLSHQSDPDFFQCYPIEKNAHWGRKFMDRITPREALDAVIAVEGRSHDPTTCPSTLKIHSGI